MYSQYRSYTNTEFPHMNRCSSLYCIVFIHFYSASQSVRLSEALPSPDHSNYTLQATASEGLAQGPYVADVAEFKPKTLGLKGIDSTNAPPRPTRVQPDANIFRRTLFSFVRVSCLLFLCISINSQR